jgi:hypothetical protein
MKILNDFIPHIKMSKGIFFHFNSCLENLLEMDEGRKQFVREQVALRLYESLDKQIILELDSYTEDFFSLLTLISELGKCLVNMLFNERLGPNNNSSYLIKKRAKLICAKQTF